MSKTLVIFLHGVGSNGHDLAALGQLWAKQLPGVIFAAPNAPFPCDFGNGYQWFSLDGVTEQNRPQRIVEARAAFDKTLQQTMTQQQIDPATDNVVLVGFSQGSIMSLDLLVSGRLPVTAIVAFSGRLASPKPWKPLPDTSVLLLHGTSDPVIPWQNSQSAATELAALGVKVQLELEAGVVHTISAKGANKAIEFIKNLIK
ncbi:alpha/beta hydrolase [Shewanella dokdonensis]|uniref:Dienelactone hydrolase family protein n=1 Tax=Shewanella dokdonensis TaxID=712036 RepID=A0ABX8DKR9_9GAMM|nr:dienelactone hydrolase family protein [Shewanella dokdonensis]MCL1076334.1 dienelactone hydrolase family protein [Shewanella dokdonensis]QVK24507.1 dienelactone hydrolase family protein [Shewanella dokdonensis]